ncbi:tyrosine aminotransferase-like isoform X2 [Tubulanus polymorphus]
MELQHGIGCIDTNGSFIKSSTTATKRREWKVTASKIAHDTINPIRRVVEGLNLQPNPEKPMIALSIGDPTVFGNLPPSPDTVNAVKEVLEAGKSNGYVPAVGIESTRAAIAQYYNTEEAPLTSKDVILTSGCSSALEMCITVLANPGQNILVPRPGFPLYTTLANSIGIETKHYDLVPERGWEIDLDHFESLIDDKTAAIVLNSPSNPCGSVFSKQHIKHILEICETYKIPVIADEIYAFFTFPGNEFHFTATLTTTVPVLSCGGLTKRYLVPGWRCGWILINDKQGIFGAEVRLGLQNLITRFLGPNTLIQAAVPAILANTKESFFEQTAIHCQKNAEICFKELSKAKGLHPIMPQGAMYFMVRFDMAHFPEYKTDLELVEALVSEQSVFCLPGKCFSIAGYVRIVLTVPEEQMVEACKRIQEFTRDHYTMKKHNEVAMETPMEYIMNGMAAH